MRYSYYALTSIILFLPNLFFSLDIRDLVFFNITYSVVIIRNSCPLLLLDLDDYNPSFLELAHSNSWNVR